MAAGSNATPKSRGVVVSPGVGKNANRGSSHRTNTTRHAETMTSAKRKVVMVSVNHAPGVGGEPNLRRGNRRLRCERERPAPADAPQPVEHRDEDQRNGKGAHPSRGKGLRKDPGDARA